MSVSLFDLSGRTALITGSSRGLGRVMARGLARAGARVVLNGRNPDALDGAVEAFRSQDLQADGAAFDVTDKASIDAAVDRIETDIAPVDILVNNAGIQDRGPAEELSEEAWRRVIDTNLTSVFLLSQAVGRRMIGRGRGKIICTCSLMSEITRPSISNYSAAKGGVKMLVRALCVEWAKHGVQVNGIGPGYFLTDLTRPLHDDPTFNAWITGRTPAGRWGDPEELVGAAIYLASAASDFVNGQILYVDGGILAAV